MNTARPNTYSVTAIASLFAVVLLCVLASQPAFTATGFDHAVWNSLLQKHVHSSDGGKSTQVDYAGMAAEEATLQAYLGDVASVSRDEFERWTREEQLALLINLYNAATVALILEHYPSLDSIKDTGSLFRSPWSRPRVALFGERVSLDTLEHEMIRGWPRFQEPRIHFAVNCAAIGCPPLRAEAYTGARLEQQLEDNTQLFLSDRSRNYPDGRRVYVSKIFDWYEEDFEQGWQGIDSVAEFLANYAEALGLSAAQAQSLRAGDYSIRYLSYDWGLNRQL